MTILTVFNTIEKFFVLISYIGLLVFFPLSLFLAVMVVRQDYRVVILRNGKLRSEKTYGPGLIFHLPCIDILKFVDLRICSYEVPPQEVLTKDSLGITVEAVVHYKITNPVDAVMKVADYKNSTEYLAETTIRNAIGSSNLNEILHDRQTVSKEVCSHMQKFCYEWGVKILRADIKDIKLPIQLQKAMASEAESLRLANARAIAAQAEGDRTKSLQEATRLLMENPMGMQLRYLQSLQRIAGDKTHTVVLPFSVNGMKQMFHV